MSTKRLLALLLALTMCFSLAAPAYAAETDPVFTVTLVYGDGRTETQTVVADHADPLSSYGILNKPETPTRADADNIHYVFDFWASSYDGSDFFGNSDTATIRSDETITARWTEHVAEGSELVVKNANGDIEYVTDPSKTITELVGNGTLVRLQSLDMEKGAALGNSAAVAQIGSNSYSTLQAAIAEANDGDTITLLENIALEKDVIVTTTGENIYCVLVDGSYKYQVPAPKLNSLTIDGNNHTISMASNHAYGGKYQMTGQSAFFFGAYDNTVASSIPDNVYTLKNITFSGFDCRIINAKKCTVNLENCSFLDNHVTLALGDSPSTDMIATLNAALKIDGCTFESNTTSGKYGLIYTNNQEADSYVQLTGNLFQNNGTAQNPVYGNGLALLSNAAASNDAVEDNTFTGNYISMSDGNAAVIYASKPVESITGNLFTGNHVTAPSSKKAGVIVLGSGTTGSTVTENAFVDNTLSGAATKIATMVVGSASNISNNYWSDGTAPVTGTNEDIYIDGSSTITNTNYATAYTANANANGCTVTLAQKVAKNTTTNVEYTSVGEALNAAADGQIVALIANDTIPSNASDKTTGRINYTGSVNVTLDLAGYTIDSYADVGIVNNGSGVLTIKDSVGNGKVTVENALDSENDTIWARTGNIVIESGTFINKSKDSATIYVGSNAVDPKPGLTISGGSFENLDKTGYTWKPAWPSLVLNVAQDKVTSRPYGTLSVTGGTFKDFDPAWGDDNLGGTFVATGYESLKSGNDYTVQQVKVAKNTTTNVEYTSLDAAIEAANAGETITLLNNITYGADREVSVWSKAVNLDLGGHTLTTNSTVSTSLGNNGYKAAAICYSIPEANAGRVTVSNGTIVTAYGAGVYADDPGLTLTLSNLTINAAQTGVQSTAEYSSAVRITGGAKVIIESGSYSGYNAIAVSNSGGEFEISGGKFSGALFINTSGTAAKKISISGGHFTADPTAYLAAGYEKVNSTESDYYYTVQQKIVARIGNATTGMPYPSLAAAIEAAESGDTIYLVDNDTITSTVNIQKSLTIVGSDNTLTATGSGSGYAFYVMDDGDSGSPITVEFQNVTINSTGFQTAFLLNDDAVNGHTLTLKDVTITSDGECVYGNGANTVNATDCTFTHDGQYFTGKDAVYYSAVMVGYSGVVNLTDCTINSSDYGIATFPTGSTINVYNTNVNLRGTASVSDPAALWVRVDNTSYVYNNIEYAVSSAINVYNGSVITGGLKFTNTSSTHPKTALITCYEGSTFSVNPTTYLDDTCGTVIPNGYEAVQSGNIWVIQKHVHTYDYDPGNPAKQPAWTWGRINGAWAAAASFNCVKNDHTENVRATISENTTQGIKTITATVTFNGKDYTAEKTEDVSYTVYFNNKSNSYKWGELCTLTYGDGNTPREWTDENGTVLADGRGSYTFPVTANINVYANSTQTVAPVAVISATLTSSVTKEASFNAKWSLPSGATVNSVTIYRGWNANEKTYSADVLRTYGTPYNANLFVRNGDYTLGITGLTTGNWQYAVIVINYTPLNGSATELVSDVVKVQVS